MAAYSFNGSTLITVAPTVDTDAVSSLTFTSQYDVSAYITPPVLFGIDFDTTGAKIFLAQGRASAGFYVSSSPLIPPYDITSIGSQIGSANGTTGPAGSNVAGFAYAKDGSAFYSAFDSGLVYEWGTTTPFDQGTMAYTAQFSPTITDALALSEDGTKFYTVANNSIYTYTLATPWRVANNSLLGNTSFAALTTGTITDLSLNITGDQLVLLDSLGTVISLQLATPFVIASYIDRGTRATVPNAVGGAGKLANNGNDFYVGQTATSIIDRYAVTPRNFSNGAFTRNPNILFTGSGKVSVTPYSGFSLRKTNNVITGSSGVTVIPLITASFVAVIKHYIAPSNGLITVKPTESTGWDLARAKPEFLVPAPLAYYPLNSPKYYYKGSQVTRVFSEDGLTLTTLYYGYYSQSIYPSFSRISLSIPFDFNAAYFEDIPFTGIVGDTTPSRAQLSNPDNQATANKYIYTGVTGVDSYNVGGPFSNGNGIYNLFLSDDGLNIYFILSDADNLAYTKFEGMLYQYKTTIPFDFTNVTFVTTLLFTGTLDSGLRFKNNGLTLFFGDAILVEMSVPYDLSTHTFLNEKLFTYSSRNINEIDSLSNGSKSLLSSYINTPQDVYLEGLQEADAVSSDSINYTFTPTGQIYPINIGTTDLIFQASSIDKTQNNTSLFPVSGLLLNPIITPGEAPSSPYLSTPFIRIPKLTNAQYIKVNHPVVTLQSSVIITPEALFHRTQNIAFNPTGNISAVPASKMVGVTRANASVPISLNKFISSNTGATTTLNGFNTQINSRGSYSPNTVNITKFNTLLTSGSGSIATLGGMNKAFSSTVSAPAYGTCALNSFSTGIISKGSIGSFDTVYCRGFLSQLTASTGAISSLDKFTTTLLSNGSMGAVANASLLSFNTALFSSVSTQDVGNARLRAPIISMLRGDVAITGFSTKILSNNHLVVNNSVAYAVNIKSMETTSYTGYGFDYIVRLAGSYYGVKPDGLYLLEGNDDNGSPIDATIRTNETDFGTSHLKQVPYVYIDTESQTTLSTIVDNLFNASELSVFNGRRTQLSKGSKGRYWAFEIKNVNGGLMRVGAIEPNVNKLKRRV